MRDIRTEDLCFFVFGITPSQIQEDEEKAIKTCISKSYLDLNRTIKYFHSISELEEKDNNGNLKIEDNERERFEKAKDEFKTNTKEIIFEAINNVSDFIKKNENEYRSPQNCEDNFDKWHFILSSTIVKTAKNTDRLFEADNSFSFGQAQKWINMTLKYMRIMGFSGFKDDYLHIPLDDYILTALKKSGKICDPYDIEGLNISSSLITKWSKIDDYQNYFKLQLDIRNALKGKMTPIEWESKAWIAEAKYRNDKKYSRSI